jgi:hypothetical protein
MGMGTAPLSRAFTQVVPAALTRRNPSADVPAKTH